MGTFGVGEHASYKSLQLITWATHFRREKREKEMWGKALRK